MIDFLLNIFFPPRCVSCKREGDFLCKNCVHKFRITPIQVKSVNPSSAEFNHLDGVIYGADYAKNPELQSAIAQFKYKFTQALKDCFAHIVCQKMRELRMLDGRSAVLIPVPLHKRRLRYRGFNQAELIATAAAAKFGVRARVLYPLRRIRHTSQQARLSKAERHRNLDEAFEVTSDIGDIHDSICFLVDDVCTTGATLDSCAKELKEAGIKKVYGLVVARAFK